MNVEIEFIYAVIWNKTHIKLHNYFIERKSNCLDYSENSNKWQRSTWLQKVCCSINGNRNMFIGMEIHIL